MSLKADLKDVLIVSSKLTAAVVLSGLMAFIPLLLIRIFYVGF